MTAAEHEADVLIVGAGPVGLFGVFACGQLGMRAMVVDALPEAGGQCTALYPEKPIYDIPGRASITAARLVDDLLEQVAPFRPEFAFGERVTGVVEGQDGTFDATTGCGRRIKVRAILVAAGAGAFEPKRPPLSGIEAFEGTGVFYHVKDPETFRDTRIVIGGGGDSAVDWALALLPVAASVTLVHRRPKFRAAPDSVRKLREASSLGRIRLAIPRQLAGLEGCDGRLTGVTISDMGGMQETLPADVLLPFYGLSTDLGAFADWGLDAGTATIPVDPLTCETRRPGVFAAGDVAGYPGKLKLILSGFAEITTAAHAAYARVFPGKALHFEHSTTKGRPGAEQSAAA